METNNTLSSALATAPLALRIAVAARAYSPLSPCSFSCNEPARLCTHTDCRCGKRAAVQTFGGPALCPLCASESVVSAAVDGEDDAEVAAAIVLADAALAECVS